MTVPKTNRESFFDSPWCELVWLGISALCYLLFAWSVSPLYVNEGVDSAIFKIVGQGVLEGKLPYRDLFDHKGPVVFYLNALGLWIAGGKIGLWLLNALALSATLSLVYRISRLFSSAKRSFWIVLFSLLYWVIFAEGGNLSESYALPAVALSLYLVLRLFQNPQKTFAGYFVGLSFAWMFLLRMNDAVMLPGGLFAGFFLYGLIQKRYKQIILATLWFLAGVATLVLPFVIYFSAQDAFADFWYGQFTFNYLYSKKNSHAFINYGNLVVGLLLVVSCVLAIGKKKENSWLYFVFVPVAVFSFFLLGKRLYSHYFLVFLPFFALCISLVRNKYYLITLFCAILGGFGGAMNYYLRCFRRECKTAEVYAQAGRLFEKIPECEKNDIWLYNAPLGIFPHHNITPCNRIFCYWHLKYDNLAQTEGIRSHQPNWVLVDKKSPYRGDFDYIETNYELVYKTDSAVCQLELYRWSGTEP